MYRDHNRDIYSLSLSLYIYVYIHAQKWFGFMVQDIGEYGDYGRDIYPITENQMEKNTEHEMDTRFM